MPFKNGIRIFYRNNFNFNFLILLFLIIFILLFVIWHFNNTFCQLILQERKKIFISFLSYFFFFTNLLFFNLILFLLGVNGVMRLLGSYTIACTRTCVFLPSSTTYMWREYRLIEVSSVIIRVVRQKHNFYNVILILSIYFFKKII